MIVMITGGIILNYTDKKINNISIDTRTIEVNDLFIPIKGKNKDGNDYLQDAVLKGASIVLTTNNDVKNLVKINKDIGIIKVDSGIEALKKIALYYRNKYTGLIIAVTGSCGKTTTKEMIYSCLSSKYKVFKSFKNYNNIIGICKNILSLNDEDVAVFELGMNHENEIKEMVSILKPEIGVITNITEAHIGNLGSLENIFLAKKEIIHKDMKVLFLNCEDLYLKKIDFHNIVWANKNDFHYEIYEDYIYIKDFDIKVNAYGFHNIYNIIIAILLAKYLKLSDSEIKEGLERYSSYRMKKYLIKEALIIDDTYNANIASMKAAIDYLNTINYKTKILVLGDMLELGSYSSYYHKELGIYIRDKKIDKVYTLGEDSKYIGNSCQKISFHYIDKKVLANDLKNDLKSDVAVLIKGSRLLNMEDIIYYLK